MKREHITDDEPVLFAMCVKLFLKFHSFIQSYSHDMHKFYSKVLKQLWMLQIKNFPSYIQGFELCLGYLKWMIVKADIDS